MATHKGKRKKVLVVTAEDLFGQGIAGALKGKGYRSEWVAKFRLVQEAVYLEPPELLLMDDQALRECRSDLLTWMNAGKFHSRVPIIVMVGGGDLGEVAKIRYPPLDDYLLKPFSQEELLLKVEFCFNRGDRQWERNPLTLLPGNLSIIKEIQKRLDDEVAFAFAHCDLGEFKSFNDRYGFSRGDEVLRMVARIITNTVAEEAGEDGFVGHIGGDDFVFLVSSRAADKVCQLIMKKFDQILPTFYDKEDQERGFIVSLDRRGNENRFSFMTIAIGVASNETRTFSHYGEISEVANDLKNFAKKWPQSHCCQDKRAG